MAKTYKSPPAMQIDPARQYHAIFHTEVGNFKIELFADKAPKTVNNFVFLAKEGFYDGTTFHRVLENFMAQGGCPLGTGTGGPGYRFDDEASALTLRHDKPGMLSMANAGANTNGSQFFITHIATPWLDGKHAVFGRVVEGFDDVVMQIRLRDPMRDPNPGVRIDSVEIVTS